MWSPKVCQDQNNTLIVCEWIINDDQWFVHSCLKSQWKLGLLNVLVLTKLRKGLADNRLPLLSELVE